MLGIASIGSWRTFVALSLGACAARYVKAAARKRWAVGCLWCISKSPKLWVHHCAPTGDSTRPASSSELSSVCEIRWAAGHEAVSPIGCTPWCVRPRLHRRVGQSPSSLAGSFCEALSEGTVELWLRSFNLEDGVINGGREPPACNTHKFFRKLLLEATFFVLVLPSVAP